MAAALLGTLGFTATLGVLSPALTVARGVPQAVRLYRRPDAEGVSAGTWLLVIVVAELWLCYGAVFNVPAEIAANIPNAVLAGLIVRRVATLRGTGRRSLVAVTALSAAAGAVAATSLGPHHGWLLPTAAVAGALCLYLPQLARVLQRDDLVGVSAATWLLALATALSWGAYGLLIHQVPVWLPSAVMTPSSLLIVIRVLRPRPAR